jgi:hypothetical protein
MATRRKQSNGGIAQANISALKSLPRLPLCLAQLPMLAVVWVISILDFVPGFIQAARQEFAGSPAEFEVFDLFKDAIPTTYDYLLLSGVFNNQMDDNWGFMSHALRTMFEGARKGISFNAMSTYVDYHDDGLFYVDPGKVFDFCKKNLSNKVTLRHDYVLSEGGFPFEFAVYVYK